MGVIEVLSESIFVNKLEEATLKLVLLENKIIEFGLMRGDIK
jgi:hypothetical protein